jgi:hypothetical protein
MKVRSASPNSPRIHHGQCKAWTWFSGTAIILFAIGLAATTGCGPRTDRLELSGHVTLDGQPLDSGSIRFTSQGSQKLMASGAVITGGEFNIPREKGLPPGTYSVEVSAPDTSAPLVSQPAAPGEPRLPPTAPERIPAEYNENRSIEVTVDGDNHFRFDIESRPAR